MRNLNETLIPLRAGLKLFVFKTFLLPCFHTKSHPFFLWEQKLGKKGNLSATLVVI